MLSMISCVYGFNHYGVREVLLNNNMKGNKCPWCSEIETWNRVIKYKKTKDIRRKYIVDLATVLLKDKEDYVRSNEIFNMLEDIIVYLENGDPEEYETRQYFVGMNMIFRGFIVKD